MILYQKAKQFMVNAFMKAGDNNGIEHHERTVYWVKQLKPDASEILLTVAIMHDIERAILR